MSRIVFPDETLVAFDPATMSSERSQPVMHLPVSSVAESRASDPILNGLPITERMEVAACTPLAHCF